MSKIVLVSDFSSVKTTCFRESTLRKGQRLYNAKHVSNLKEIWENSQTVLSGKCVPQTKVNNPPYLVEIVLDQERLPSGGRCSCPAGVGACCKHSAAVVCAINNERSEVKTSQECQWKKPTKKQLELYPKGKKVTEILKYPDTKPRPTFHPPSEELHKEMIELMSKAGVTNSMVFNVLTAKVSFISFCSYDRHQVSSF